MVSSTFTEVDPQLVRAAVAGSDAAWSELYTTYGERLVAYVRALNGAADPEDVAQLVWLQVMKDLPTLKDPTSFDSWVRTIARRTVYRTTRSHRREQALEQRADVLESPEGSLDDYWIEAEDADRARRAVRELAGRNRQLVEGRLIADLEAAELAEALGWTTDSVHVGLARARKALRRAYDRLPLLVPPSVWRFMDRRRLELVVAPEFAIAIAALVVVLAPSSQPAEEVATALGVDGETVSLIRDLGLDVDRADPRLRQASGATRGPDDPNPLAELAPDHPPGTFDEPVTIDGLGHTGFYGGDYHEFDEPDVYVGSPDTVEVRYWVFEDVPAERPEELPDVRVGPDQGPLDSPA